MGEFLEIYNARDLKMVDVRRYEGIESGKHAWTFLGYDVVSTDKDGKAVSILAQEEVKYDYLKKVDNPDGIKGIDYFDHSDISVGDIRVRTIDAERLEIFGRFPVVSKSAIKTWIDKRPGFSFLHYKSVKETAKVKSLKNK